MDKRLHLLTALGALTLGAAITTAPSVAAKFAGVDLQSCVRGSSTEAQCACEVALDNGRPEVLAKFFKTYASQAKNTACAALASTKVRGQTGNGNANSNPPSGNGASGGD